MPLTEIVTMTTGNDPSTADLPRYIFAPKGAQHRSVTRHWGGVIVIWRGGALREHRTTLASYRRLRRWMTERTSK